MKSSKGDGVKYIQPKGSSAANETGPLFPRLHINDTEKAGPRAPPRNKMALYEQFTVPSHRFVQGSRTQTASANGQQQIGLNDYGYPYLSYYVPPAMPYGNMNYVVPSHTQPSFGMSSCVTSSGSALVCNQESQKTSKTLSAEKSASPGALRAVARKGGSATMMGLKTEHKSQDMSMRNASRQSPRKGDPQKLSRSGGMHRQCDMSDSVKLGEGPSAMEVTKELQQALSDVEGVLECTMSNNHNRETSTCTETTNLERRKEGNDLQVKGPASTDRPIEQADGIVPALPEQTVQLPVVHSEPVEILLHESLSLGNDTPQADMNRDGSTSGEGHMAIEEEPAVRASGKDELQTAPMEETSGTFSLWKDKETCLADGDNVAEKLSVTSPLKTKDDSIRQVKNKQTNINNVSGPSQASCGGAPQGSMYSVEGTVSTHDFRPKDVIRAFGQQQFWKARKALLRQQRIFSDQVFQLHKLIKVQQLLAETPGTLIEDEMPSGAMEENDAYPLYQSFADRDLSPGEEGCNGGFSFGAKDEEQPHLEGTYSGDLQASEHVADGNGVESTPFMPTPGPGGISAWGYPSQGIGQWMGPVPAPGGSFAYPLTAGAFTLGPPYGGLYGMPMPGTIPPLVPFGIPFSGQANELQEEVSSNHGPAAARIQQNVTALGQMASHTPNDVAHMWQCLQYSNPHYNQGFYDNASSKGVPAGSVASINNQKALRAPSSSRMQHTLGMASHFVGVDANRREHSVHQGESLSPIRATKAQLNPSAPVPSSRRGLYSYRDVEQLARHPDSEDTRRPQGSIRSEAERAVVQTEADSGPMKSLKCYQNVASTNEDGEERSVCRYPLDHSENALDLFPQVPFLNSVPLVGWKQERLAEEGQSRVIKAVPRPAVAASQSTASILLSLQQQRHR